MMNTFKAGLILLVICILPFAIADAATNNFTVRTLIGEDTEAPSTPVIQSVTPVTSYQIDVVWGPSVDNYSLSGYRVYRDGQVVATTTQTFFSDFDLTPSTTYAYTIDAFDTFNNVSSTSLPVATTTPALPPVTPTTTPTTTVTNEPQATHVAVRDVVAFAVTPSQRSAAFDFEMGAPIRYVALWGRSTEYELGSLATNIYKAKHAFVVQGLEPGTRYFYKVVAVDARGATFVVREDTFTTEVVTTTTFPRNVDNVVGIVSGNNVSLSWQNPTPFTPGSLIRIVRSHLFYPLGVTDGVVVYEGAGESFVDAAILKNHSPYFYTIFLMTPDGYVSSGAIFMADKDGGEVAPVSPSATSTTPSIPVTPPEIGDDLVLRASDVLLNQGTVVVSFDQVQKLQAGAETRIIVPKAALPVHLKSIVVTIFNPTNNNRFAAYLLKLSPDGSQYEATFVAPAVDGEAALMLEVFDYNNATVRRLVTKVVYVSAAELSTWPRFWWWLSIATSIVGITSALWFILWRRRREDNRHAK